MHDEMQYSNTAVIIVSQKWWLYISGDYRNV